MKDFKVDQKVTGCCFLVNKTFSSTLFCVTCVYGDCGIMQRIFIIQWTDQFCKLVNSFQYSINVSLSIHQPILLFEFFLEML